MDPEEREDWASEPELEPEEEPAVTRRFREIEARQTRKRAVGKPRPRSTAWIALILLLASIYIFWVLPYQLGSHPVDVKFTRDNK